MVSFEEMGQIVARKASVFAYGNHKAEPGWIRMGSGLRQEQAILIVFQHCKDFLKVDFAPLNKVCQLGELCQTNRSLHVSGFKVVADMGINVLVIVAERQRSELLAEALATCIVFTPGTITVASPISDR